MNYFPNFVCIEITVLFHYTQFQNIVLNMVCFRSGTKEEYNEKQTLLTENEIQKEKGQHQGDINREMKLVRRHCISNVLSFICNTNCS